MYWRDIAWSIKTITPSTTPALTVQEVKDRCRLWVTDDDADIVGLIAAAQAQLELDTNCAAAVTVYQQTITAFPGGPFDAPADARLYGWSVNAAYMTQPSVPLMRWPLISVASVTTYDTNNAASVFSSASYRTDTAGIPGRIVLNPNASWPSALRADQAVVIQFTAGFGSANPLPAAYRLAMLLFVQHLYDGTPLSSAYNALIADRMMTVA